MATTLTDTMYVDVTGLSPSPSASLSPATLRHVARRWQYWIPWCSLALARAHVRLTLPAYERIHREAIRKCLVAGLRWPTILRNSLDDPRMADEDRDREILEAVERRRCRMGRVKGQTRQSYAVEAQR